MLITTAIGCLVAAIVLTKWYFLYRREWVHRIRVDFIVNAKDPHHYRDLISFEDMIFKYWYVWDKHSLYDKRH